jgi:hypothetical protein
MRDDGGRARPRHIDGPAGEEPSVPPLRAIASAAPLSGTERSGQVGEKVKAEAGPNALRPSTQAAEYQPHRKGEGDLSQRGAGQMKLMQLKVLQTEEDGGDEDRGFRQPRCRTFGKLEDRAAKE